MIPLLVHIIFHPKSDDSRKLAERIHLALNDDPAVPGLRLPTRFAIEDGTHLPPSDGVDFTAADRTFILVLADDYIKVRHEGKVPHGRQDWGEWVADVYGACEAKPLYRCIPFQMTENAWPLHERLEEVNFPRAWAVDEDERNDWVINRVILELVRFLHGEGKASEEDPKAPLKVFVSHTKMDLEKEPRVVRNIMNYLTQDQPVDAWYDSGDIGAGSRFAREIEKGVENSALLCVLTDAYSSREWCRKEILLAKERQRPVVVVDALQSLEMRSFPYGGNVPVIRWLEVPELTLNLLFKETLRQLHAKLVLEKLKQPGDFVLPISPELVMVVGKPEKSFLYPDPPIGEAELQQVLQTGVAVETPLQRFAKNRPLAGKRLAISLSESGDTERYGTGLVHLDQAAIEISRYLLLAGAILCYGGHLGSESYTVSLFELVKSHPIPGLPPLERIVNYIGWPLPSLSVSEKAEYMDHLKFKQMPRPPDLSEADDPLFVETVKDYFPPDTGLKRFAWARGMTMMREAQSQDRNIIARIVLGGKIGPTVTAQPDGTREVKWYSSRIPGVLEEILCSLKYNQPVYLVGGYGGCARLASDLLQGKTRDEMSWGYHKNAQNAPEMRTLFETRKNVDWWGYSEMTQFLKDRGIEGLNNGLTVQENLKLFEELDTFEIVRLLLKGLKELV